MTGNSDEALRRIVDLLTKQQENIKKQYSDDKASILQKKTSDITDVFSICQQKEHNLNEDIESCESIVKLSKLKDVIAPANDILFKKKQELGDMKQFEIKRINSVIARYEKDLRRIRMAYETMMVENTAALETASVRVAMRTRYHDVYPQTAARNPYVMQC